MMLHFENDRQPRITPSLTPLFYNFYFASLPPCYIPGGNAGGLRPPATLQLHAPHHAQGASFARLHSVRVPARPFRACAMRVLHSREHLRHLPRNVSGFYMRHEVMLLRGIGCVKLRDDTIPQ